MMSNYSVNTTIAQLEVCIKQGLQDVGQKLEADAKALAPVKTGKLRDSIYASVSDNEVTVGSDLVYAPIQELKKHYLEQAANKNSTYIANIMADKMK